MRMKLSALLLSDLAACAGRQTTPAGPATSEPGYQLAALAMSCWYGGVWDDVEARPVAQRQESSQQRCHELTLQVTGRDDPAFYEQVRATTHEAVRAVADKVGALAQNPREAAHRKDLVALIEAVGAAQHENMYARRAADRLLKDAAGERLPGKVGPDQAEAARSLGADGALQALLKLNAGPLSPDAHALGLLAAMDRLELARGLANERKLYAVEGALHLVFGAPEVRVDPQQPLPPGQWLSYLTEAAQAAGHPVPPEVSEAHRRDTLAWGGVLAGFADQISADTGRLSEGAVPVLSQPLHVVARRLDNEYKVLQSQSETHP